MGDYYVTDCITRLPIIDGDDILALYGYYVYDERHVVQTALHPFSLMFHPRADKHRVKCFFGKYDGSGGLIGEPEFDYGMVDGYSVFMRRETYDMVFDEWKRYPVSGMCWGMMATEECNLRHTRDALAKLSKRGDTFLEGLLKDYGFDALDWGLRQLGHDCSKDTKKFFAKLEDDNDINEWDFTMAFVAKRASNKLNSEERKTVTQFAKEYAQILRPIEWYCSEARVYIAGAEATGGQCTNFPLSMRLGEFIMNEAKRNTRAED